MDGEIADSDSSPGSVGLGSSLPSHELRHEDGLKRDSLRRLTTKFFQPRKADKLPKPVRHGLKHQNKCIEI